MVLITESKLRKLLRKGIPNPFPFNEGDKITPAAMDFLRDRKIGLDDKRLGHSTRTSTKRGNELMIPVGVSNRHLHLSSYDIQLLFGENYELTPLRQLSQEGQFAAKEQVTLLGPKGLIKDVRVLGPARGETQVEISITDGFQLGIHPQVRLSGSIEDTPGLTLIGPKGCVSLQKGVIVAQRHVHMSPENASEFGVNQGETLLLQTPGERSVIFTDVVVRVDPNFQLDFHLDLDEGNAAGLKTGDQVKVIGKNGELLSWEGR